MAVSNRETRRYDGSNTYADVEDFARVIVFKQPVEVQNRGIVIDRYQFLFAEALHKDGWRDVSSLKPTDAVREQGWRIYYQKQDPDTTILEGERETPLRNFVRSDYWFALRAKGPDVVGVYFPAELQENAEALTELIEAIDAYFRSTNALVETPEELNIKKTHVNPHGVADPWTGRPECCVDFALHERGFARINEMSIDREDPIYQPAEVAPLNAPVSMEVAAR